MGMVCKVIWIKQKEIERQRVTQVHTFVLVVATPLKCIPRQPGTRAGVPYYAVIV